MEQNLKTILDFIQQNEIIAADLKDTFSKTIKDVDKELAITTFKLDRTEKVKRTTAILLEETIEELELKRKAVEAQNRDLEIEAALEKIRSRSLAMHKSDELWEVVAVVFEKFQELKFSIDGAAFIATFIEGTMAFNCWLASDQDQSYPTILKLPYYDTPTLNDMWLAKESGLDFFSKTYSIEEKNPWLSYAFEHTDLKIITDEFKNWMLEQPFLTQSLALGKNSLIGIHFHHQRTLSETEVDILKRFSKVFDQAYIRFLDLQKAEAQAREAQIEAALERVRSRTMAMHKSDELREVIQVVFEQLVQLKLEISNIGFLMDFRKTDDYDVWTTDAFAEFPTKLHIPYFEHPFNRDYVEHKGLDLFTKVYSFEEKNTWLKGIWELISTGNSTETENVLLSLPALALSRVALKNVALYSLNFFGIPFSDEQNSILIRVGTVFEQTYTRFLDLQKAEAQAREAQIEAALERVRSRTMAMQKSDELAKVAGLLFQQVSQLGIKTWTTGFNVWSEDNNSYVDYITNPQGNIIEAYTIDTTKFPVFIEVSDAKKSGEEFWVQYLEGDLLKETYMQLNKFGDDNQYEKMLEDGFQFPSHQYDHFVFGSTVSLMFITYNPVPEAHDIFKRFGKVFEQTYTRFLDIQKAEAQAREAQIEASLERIRARSMAMQRSSELAEAAQLLYQQFHSLGIKTYTCAYMFIEEEKKRQRGWAVASDGTLLPDFFEFPLTGDTILDQRFVSWKNKQPIHEAMIQGEANKQHHTFLVSMQPPEFAQHIVAHLPEQVFFYNANFLHGYLFIVNTEPFTSEEKNIAIRFAKVFEQTYTRFLDLQKAETQAREAQIEAALEKVRSRSLAMHKGEELVDVLVTVYEKMTELKVDFNSANILIFQDHTKDIEYWTINNVQQKFSQFSCPYVDYTAPRDIAKARADKLSLITKNYHGKEHEELLHYLFEQSDFRKLPEERKQMLRESEEYTISIGIGKRIGIQINSYYRKAFTTEENEILKRFTTVFEQSYIRFLDLQKAEVQAREAQIEAALERVRAQAMAMHHSEDLGKTIEVYYEQLDNLIDTTIVRCGAGLLNKENTIAEMSTASRSPEAMTYHVNGTIDMQGHPLLERTYEHWLKQKEYHHILRGNEIKEYYQFITNQVAIPENTGDDELYFYFPMFTEGSFYVVTNNEVPEDELQIFRRFGSVLSLTYRRFNDLLKAEAQTREAQIEAALERVRASTMAMHKSEQLSETAKVLFEQFDLLGKIPDRISIGIIKEEKQLIEWWVTNQNGSQLNYGFNASIAEPSMAKVFNAWKEKKDSIVIDLTGKDLKDWIRFVREEVKMEIDEANMKGRRVHQGAFFSQGVLLFSTHEPVAKDVIQLLIRFARVFSQTYTRFLDLQKAEMQAKEAIKASSLDRVRGEIASMRTIDDLQRITPIIWHELTALGVPFIRCGVFIINESTSHIQIFLSAPDGKSLAAMDLPFDSSELTINSVNHWRQGIIFKTHWNKKEFLNFMQSMIKEGQVQNPKTYQGAAAPPESLDLHFVPFKQGMLYVGNSSPLEVDELQLVKSLAESFSIAYARYEDFRQLEEAKNQIEKTFSELKAAQSQLIQSEKMASLGELTAGIAHEIQNPLNFVNNFSEVSNELIVEIEEERAKKPESRNETLVTEILSDIKQNLEKINHHGKRAADIVKGMLQHSRNSSGTKESTDINKLADEYLRLAYHGLRAKDKSFNATMVTDFDESIGKIDIIPQDIGRVILNLITNAFYAVNDKKLQLAKDLRGFQNLSGLNAYEPTVSIITKKMNARPDDPVGRGTVEIKVIDNGNGIPQKVLDKIFQPFFTTKPTGQGTGLGLSLAYDIVKAHGGEIKVNTKENEGTELTIILPA